MRLHILTLKKHSKPVSETSILKHSIGRIRDVEALPDGSILILNDEDDGEDSPEDTIISQDSESETLTSETSEDDTNI